MYMNTYVYIPIGTDIHVYIYQKEKKKVQQYFGFEMFLVVGFDRGVSPYDRTNTVYVEEKRGWSGSAVLRSQNYFVGDQHETLIQHVEDFEIQDEYMFVTKKPVGFPCRGSNPVGTHPYRLTHSMPISSFEDIAIGLLACRPQYMHVVS